MTEQNKTEQNIIIDDDPESYGEPIKNFRIANIRIALTYTHCTLDKQEYKKWFHITTGRDNLKVFAIAHETGKNGDHNHTHVLVDFGTMFASTSPQKFDYNKRHPNIRKIGSSKHWVHWVNYMAKEDKDNKDLWKTIPKTDRVWANNNIKEALDINVKKNSDIIPTIALWNMRPLDKCEVVKPKAEWIEYLMSILEKKPDPRKIIWVYDPKGNTGKTALCKYLMVTEPQKYYCVNQMGGMHHFGTIVREALKSEWNGGCMLIDLARDAQEKSFYEPLECLKNGMITSLKYVGGTSVFNIPHVVVFANFEPEGDRLSKDRWMPGIIEIIENGNYKIIPVPENFLDLSISDKLTACYSDKDQLKDELKSKDDEIEALKQQVAEQAQAYDNKLNKMKNSLNKMTLDRDDADENVQRLRRERDEKVMEIKRLKEQVDTLTPKKSDSRDSFSLSDRKSRELSFRESYVYKKR